MGSWQVAGGVRLEVGTLTTAATVGSQISNEWEQVTFDTAFAANPVVLSQVQTQNDSTWMKTRQRNVDETGFEVALEGVAQPHGSAEVIGWLAIEETERGMWNGHPYTARRTADEVTRFS